MGTEKVNSDYFKTALSTSIVVFGFHEDKLKVLLRNKPEDPFKGASSLPTCWVFSNQEVDAVASEILEAAIGNTDARFEQLNAFSKLYRRPEGRVVNIAQITLVHPISLHNLPNEGFEWRHVLDLPTLVYDHDEILAFARERLKRRIRRRPVGFTLLPKEFTIRNIHHLYEQGLNKNLDRRNFHKKIMNSNLLIDIEKNRTEKGSKKPSKLYTFDEKEYERLSLKGYDLKF